LDKIHLTNLIVIYLRVVFSLESLAVTLTVV
jgi:hypothetical protein